MSAITGLIDWRGGAAVPVVRRATAALALHGRDGEGIWDGGYAALGWRQTILAEEDLADSQPLCGAAGRFRLVFDGRIDNREDLGRKLGIASPDTRSWPDSAWVLAAFEKWREDCAEHLLGDFAFAVWDCESRSLFLCRDHIGARPLHYHRSAGFCMFATKPSALFTNPEVPCDIDDEAFVLDLALLPTPPGGTLYRDISRVPIGHSLLVTERSVRLIRHWRPETTAPIRYRRDEEYVEEFRALLDEAVRCRLRTIHPVGSQLSSGWDSSTVTVTAARLLAARGQSLTAFTSVPPVGWSAPSSFSGVADEGPIAALTARRFPSVDHVLIPGSGRLDLEALDRHGDAFEYPQKSVNNIGWMELLHREARGRGIRVMLSGVTGNRTISYDGFTLLPWLFRHGRFARLAAECYWLHRRTGASIGGTAASFLFPYLPDRVWDLASALKGKRKRTHFMCYGISPDSMTPARLWPIAKNRGANPANAHRRDDRVMRQVCTQTPDLGRFLTCTLGAWDVETRDPTADRRLMAFRVAVPESQFLNRGRTKWLLRRTMDGILPAELMNQRGRGQQAADWCEAAGRSTMEIRDEVERLGANARMASLVDVPLLRRLLNEWPQDTAPRADAREFARFLVVLGSARFMRRFIERPSLGPA